MPKPARDKKGGYKLVTQPENVKLLAGRIQKFLRSAAVQRKRERAQWAEVAIEAAGKPIPGLLEPDDMEWDEL